MPDGGDEWSGPSQQISTAVLSERLSSLQNAVERLGRQLERIEAGGFITRDEFDRHLAKAVVTDGRYWVVERLVFGGVAVVLLSALGAILYSAGVGR